MKKAIAVFSFVFLLSFMTVSVYADWKITLSSTSPDGESSESTFYLKDGKLKQSTGPLDIIIDLEQNTMLFVNNAGKSYWEGTKEDFEGEMESFMREMMGEGKTPHFTETFDHVHNLHPEVTEDMFQRIFFQAMDTVPGQKGIGEGFESLIKNKLRHVLTLESYFQLLEHEELEQARLSSTKARGSDLGT